MGAETDKHTERKRKPRIYMETTMFNYYFDEERGEHHKYTVRLFEMIREGVFEAYTSTYVTDELENAEKEKRERMLTLIDEYNIRLLGENDEIRRLGGIYVERTIIPKGFITDAMHIATATVYRMDMIASMNLKHIVRKKTIEMTGDINIENGYDVVRICSPKEVVEDVSKNN